MLKNFRAFTEHCPRKIPLLILLLLVIPLLPGCGAEQEAEAPYPSDTSPEDCYLCGGGIENLIPSYWGQDNIALISLNTFALEPIEINRYDRLSHQLIEEYAGVASFIGGGGTDGGFSSRLMLDCDRGYADGSVDFRGDEALDVDKAASFLCAGCLNEIVPEEISRYFGVGAIHLDTKEVRLFEKTIGGFGLGDFHIGCNLTGDSSRMGLLIFYCPIRYKEAP